jgi:general secretion pathway protein H
MRAAHGFTLIEVVVVVLIMSIMVGMIGARLTRDEGDIVRDEARRLALVLQGAQQQAILEGRPYAFVLTHEGYRFLSLNAKSQLVPIETDELLGPRALPRPLTLEPKKQREETRQRADLILFDPSGEFPVFTMMFTFGRLVWYVEGRSDGQILSAPAPEPATT